jgi:hypothetical protein
MRFHYRECSIGLDVVVRAMDSASIFSTESGKKRDIVQRILEKATTYMQKDENKRWFQVFVLDPVLTHIMDRIFPYIVIMCIIFIVLIILIMLTFYIVFTKMPAGLVSTTQSTL